MVRDQRIQDNWALIYAQRIALHLKIPFRICFCVVPGFQTNTSRHFSFLLGGLKEIAEECKRLSIGFNVVYGLPKTFIPLIIKKYKVGVVITDFFPLRAPEKLMKQVISILPEKVVFIQVDAHNIVPCWEASNKQEYGARTLRRKINSMLDTFLTEFPVVNKHPYGRSSVHISSHRNLTFDETVYPVTWAVPGTKAAFDVLDDFLKNKLAMYESDHNNPTCEALSNLSPWLHFGHISAQRVVLETMKYKTIYPKSVGVFLDEIIIRRELADNFCHYNKKYDSVESTHSWARETLREHISDARKYIYTLKQLEKAETHDPLWNAAQIQMVRKGKMHSFLRMYWAKKILEWTESPEVALRYSIYLNDKYELDGTDPNGYVGCMWSICGLHDRAWSERPIFGKVRYMNYQGSKKKFDVDAFIDKYREGSQESLHRSSRKGNHK
ncbi:putative photolyase [Cheloniid poxvirus 1]|nr:putative photolyase [Cheloniid poxvirus 1]